MKKHRKLKISRKYRETKTHNYPTISPRIVLQGSWLKQAGFASGQSLSVEVHEKMLILTLN